MKRFRYYKVASCTPEVHIGNPKENIQSIVSILKQLPFDTQLAVFPELCISGYTCQDLFYEKILLDNCVSELETFLKAMPENIVVIVGLPLAFKQKLYNCAAVCFNHEVLGVYAKNHIPMYNEYYETRWFSSGKCLQSNETITICGKEVPISNSILFEDVTTSACIGIEICEDLWVTVPVSSHLSLAGANILCNCSASNEVIAKEYYRQDLINHQSARCNAAYIYASAGPDESSSDLVFGGHDLICENGKILKERRMGDKNSFIVTEIDLDHLIHERLQYKTHMQEPLQEVKRIQFSSVPYEEIELTRTIDAYPFVPKDQKQRQQRCQHILNIQAQGLATRLKKIHCKDVVIGISGGLDSTLALLVCKQAYDLLGLDVKGIHAITMPGFGTTNRTKSNSHRLMELLNVSSEEICISNAVNCHFEDINHDPSVHDITYENSQARERTQILMDLANKYNGLVIGTGDLSELALGWCTYNGDHMSMYAVNVSVPKTLVRYIVESVALTNDTLKEVLLDIVDTPVSPELLPPDPTGNIQQKTEEVLGSYDLHDFFIYHMIRFHEEPKKIYELCKYAFKNTDDKTILQALHTFYRRFFTQQFKRNCMPDGVKVGSICFSPRGDWRMPSDASYNLWKDQLQSIQ